MRRFLNPPIDNFTRYINEKIFVDKSGIIDYTNSVIDSLDAFICVSRPRRFGKSVVANMLVAYYESGCKSKTLFKHLAISKTKLFKKHLNKYNVIYIDMADYFKSDIEVSAGLEKLKDELVDEFNKEYTDRSFDKDKMVSMFNEIYERTNRKFVFVIDEWDCPFRRRVGDVKGQKKYLEFLNELLKEKNYVALAYMTGILPIKKTGDESSLNMFSEKTIINASPLQEYFGFTESEVKSLCEKFGCSYEGVRFWYDGYTVNGIQLYNPRSVVEAIKSGVLENYWTQTQTFEALQSYIGANLFGIHDAITTLLSGEHIKIDTTKFKNDMVTFKSGDDILTLLVHLGYLTYDIETKKVGIPNHEIYSEFMSVITDMGWEDTVRQIEISEKAMGGNSCEG
ncbi:MAG: AAA family ATPase [Clostridia bacterium]|nr:AAA family ATPase [Clostridia bacterium]